MATIQCPNCQSQIKKPTNILGWIIGLLGVFFIGGFLLIVVCLSAIAAIGAAAEEEFGPADGQVRMEAGEYGSEMDQQLARRSRQ